MFKYICIFILLVSISSCNIYQNIDLFVRTLGSCSTTLLPGYGVVVSHHNRIVYQQVFGKADIVNNIPFTNNTIIAIGANTLAFTSFLVAQLVDDGVLDYDTPIINYLPEFKLSKRAISHKVTLHDLLTHHVGLSRNDFLKANFTKTPEEFLKVLSELPLSLPFRYSASFSSWGYVIAKLVIERTTGESWGTLVKQKIFRPLGMTHSYTSLYDTLRNEPRNYAFPHGVSFDSGSPVTVPIEPRDVNSFLDSMINSAASLHLSMNDLATYIKALEEKNIPNVSPDTFEELTTKRIRSTYPRIENYIDPYQIYISDYSHGFLNGNYRGAHFFCHNGGTLGHSTFIITFPREEISIAFVTNQYSYHMISELLISTYIFDQLVGYQDTPVKRDQICYHSEVDSLSPRLFTTLSTNVRQRNNFIGVYTNDVFGAMKVYANPSNYQELFLELGSFKGKLRSQRSVNNNNWEFKWYPENYADAKEYVVTFKGPNNKAQRVSITLDSDLDEFVFKK